MEEGRIKQKQREKALKRAKDTNKRIGEALVEGGFTTDSNIMQALSRQLGIKIVSLAGITIPGELLNLVDGDVLRKDRMVPIGYYHGDMNVILLAVADPLDIATIDDFTIITNLQLDPVLAMPS